MTSLPIMLTKLFYLKLQMLSNYWSAHILGIKLMYLCDCGQSLCLSLLAQIHTSTLTHTHNTMLHCHWHTFPEANPVDRSHRVNPLSEQWFPQCKKTSNPLRSENNKLIKLYLLKNKKMYDTKHDFWCNITLEFKNWMWFIISNLYGFFCRSFPCDYNECRLKLLSLRTQKHHKSIIKVVHLTCELYAKSNEFKQQVCVRRSDYSHIIFSSRELLKG